MQNAEFSFARYFVSRIEFLLTYDPSWFAEFLCSAGLFGWAVTAMTSPLFHVAGIDFILPLLALLFGPFRIFLLLNLSAVPRVAAAMAGFVCWTHIVIEAWRYYGPLPIMGALPVLPFGDLLTVGKFSFLEIRNRRSKTR